MITPLAAFIFFSAGADSLTPLVISSYFEYINNQQHTFLFSMAAVLENAVIGMRILAGRCERNQRHCCGLEANGVDDYCSGMCPACRSVQGVGSKKWEGLG